MIGETIGAYRILSQLGEGGMGAVYLAEHNRLLRKAALKVLLPELSSNAEAVERLFAEARATALIRHPNIVDVFDCDVHANGRAYISMEYLEGETLAALLGRTAGGLGAEVGTAVALAVRIATGLAAAHEHRLVHRDIKPDNVFLVYPQAPGVGAGPGVKILDFGVAKLVALGAGGRTGRGTFTGTPAYMSPEQCRGTDAVDQRADIYSLGCILFEMLCGRPPFVCDSPGELIAAHLTTPPPRASVFHPGLPAALDELVAGTLAKRREDRPQSAAALIAALLRASDLTAAGVDAALADSRLLAAARAAWRLPRAAAPVAPGSSRVGPDTVDMGVGAVAPTPPPAAPARTDPDRRARSGRRGAAALAGLAAFGLIAGFAYRPAAATSAEREPVAADRCRAPAGSRGDHSGRVAAGRQPATEQEAGALPSGEGRAGKAGLHHGGSRLRPEADR